MHVTATLLKNQNINNTPTSLECVSSSLQPNHFIPRGNQNSDFMKIIFFAASELSEVQKEEKCQLLFIAHSFSL